VRLITRGGYDWTKRYPWIAESVLKNSIKHFVVHKFVVQARPLRVWNGIFAAGDWRAKRGLKTMSPRRDRKSETTTREKWPQKRPFC